MLTSTALADSAERAFEQPRLSATISTSCPLCTLSANVKSRLFNLLLKCSKPAGRNRLVFHIVISPVTFEL